MNNLDQYKLAFHIYNALVGNGLHMDREFVKVIKSVIKKYLENNI